MIDPANCGAATKNGPIASGRRSTRQTGCYCRSRTLVGFGNPGRVDAQCGFAFAAMAEAPGDGADAGAGGYRCRGVVVGQLVQHRVDLEPGREAVVPLRERVRTSGVAQSGSSENRNTSGRIVVRSAVARSSARQVLTQHRRAVSVSSATGGSCCPSLGSPPAARRSSLARAAPRPPRKHTAPGPGACGHRQPDEPFSVRFVPRLDHDPGSFNRRWRARLRPWW